jgi:hypothetical protein
MLLSADFANAFVPYPAVEVPNAATGPLSGLTFAAKDLFDVTGYPTGGGNPLMLAKSGIKTKHAVTVQKLLDAGARFVGKTHTDELAFSMNGKNAHFGTPINGGAPDRLIQRLRLRRFQQALRLRARHRYRRLRSRAREPLRPVRHSPHARPHLARRRARSRTKLRHLWLLRARRGNLRSRR